jgi:hypothetical protein
VAEQVSFGEFSSKDAVSDENRADVEAARTAFDTASNWQRDGTPPESAPGRNSDPEGNPLTDTGSPLQNNGGVVVLCRPRSAERPDPASPSLAKRPI